MRSLYKFLTCTLIIMMLFTMFPSVTYADDGAGSSEPEIELRSNGKYYIFGNGTPILIREDGVYNEAGDKKYFDLPGENVAAVFGGSDSKTVASAKVIMESGKVDAIYGGGFTGSVSGHVEVIFLGGTCNSIYGGSNTDGTVGSVKIYARGKVGDKVVGGGYKCGVLGDIEIVLEDPEMNTLCGGNNAGTKEIGGNIDITINGNGYIGKIYGGCVNNYVRGSICIRINGDITISGVFRPMSGNSNEKVDGGARVYVPKGFPIDKIEKPKANTLRIYEDGVQVYGLVPVDMDKNGNVFANGNDIVIKFDDSDGKTYVYNKNENEKLLDSPIDNYTVYGGGRDEVIISSNITIKSGNLKAIYGGSMNADISGSSNITLSVTESVYSGITITDGIYSGGLNGIVKGTGFINIGKDVSLPKGKPSVFPHNANKTVILAESGFDTGCISDFESVRLFIDGFEVPHTETAVPSVVTREGNKVFANGIPIKIKVDNSDGKAYVYDESGRNKLLDDAVDGCEIFGGSKKGVVSSTSVTMEGGYIARIYGGGETACVNGDVHVEVTGGDIKEVIYGGSYDGDIAGNIYIYTKGPHVAKGVNGGSRNGSVKGDINIVLVDSVAKGLILGTGGTNKEGFPSSDVYGNVSLTMIDGMCEKIYGGCNSGVVRGNSNIKLEGNVMVKDVLSPLGKAGVLGKAVLEIPSNFPYLGALEGSGFTVVETEAVEPTPAPEYKSQLDKLLSTKEDEGKLTFRFINIPEPDGKLVGRPGESYFITFPDGQNMLIDAGTEESADIVIGMLKKLNVTKIDHLLASHFHVDHIGGMSKIINEFEIGTLYKPGYKVKNLGVYYTDLMSLIDDPGRDFNVVELWSGDTIDIGDVHIEVLSPEYSQEYLAKMADNPGTEDHNNGSLVLKMAYRENTVLLTGDIYAAKEHELIKKYGDKLKADLIKTPHHGDTTSNEPEFVQAVKPEIAVITHFSDTTIVNNRYKDVGARTYVTGVDGMVKVAFDGTGNPAEVLTEFVRVVRHTVTFDTNGGSIIEKVSVVSGEPVSAPESPKKEGYIFTGWYSDSNLTIAYDFNSPVTEDITLYAKWIKIADNDDSDDDEDIPTPNDNAGGSGSAGGTTPKGNTGVSGKTTEDEPAKLKPEIINQQDGTKTAVVTLNQKTVKELIEKQGGELLTIYIAEEADQSIVRLSADSLDMMLENGTDLLIKTQKAEIKIPSSIFTSDEIKDTFGDASDELNIEIMVTEIPWDEVNITYDKNLHPGGMAYEFTIRAYSGSNSINIDSFGLNTVTVTLPLTDELANEEKVRINVYRYNEITKELELCSTKVIDGKIVFTTSSFSLYTVMVNKVSFSDVKNHWADRYVHALAAKHIVNGKKDGIFAPDDKMTRAEYVAVISRALNLPKASGLVFRDVPKDSWYAGEISAAYEAGIVNGVGDSEFAPNAYITREEMAVIALRAYEYASGNTSDNITGEHFTDYDAISSWASKDVAKAKALGIVKGSNNLFRPKDDMTRAEGASILYNLLVLLEVF